MMLKKKSNNWARLKLMLLVPVGFIALTVFARPEAESTRPVAETQVPPPPLPSALKQSKSTKSQNDDKKIYGLYLSFNEINENGQKTVNCTAYQGTEEKELQAIEKAIQNGKFKKAPKIYIRPFKPTVPQSYLEKIKDLFEANGFKCKINKAEGYDEDGNILPPPPLPAPASSKKEEDVAPPPPPRAPDVSVSISYNNEDKEQCFYVYNFFLKEDIKTQIDKIYNDDIVAMTIKPSKNAIADLPDRIEKAFKEKIKFDVKYEVIRK